MCVCLCVCVCVSVCLCVLTLCVCICVCVLTPRVCVLTLCVNCVCVCTDLLEPRAGSVKNSARGPGDDLYRDPRFIGGAAGVVVFILVLILIFALLWRRSRKRQLLPQKPMKRVIIMKPVSPRVCASTVDV